MKWNIEWVDLKNIEQMAAECWRMSDRQLMQYCKELWEKRELVFAGELGKEFFRLLCESVDRGTTFDWAKLQKDVRLMLEMIQDGQGQDEDYWKSQYQNLTEQNTAYFYTAFGRNFTVYLAEKLELELSESQKMLRRDIHIIQGICDACNWEDEAAVQKALAILKKKEKNSFSSWLGEGFVNLLEEKYGKKQETILETLPEPEPEPERHGFFRRKRSLASRLLFMALISVSISFVSFFLYIRIQGEQGGAIITSFKSVLESVSSGKKYSEDKDTKVNNDGFRDYTETVADANEKLAGGGLTEQDEGTSGQYNIQSSDGLSTGENKETYTVQGEDAFFTQNGDAVSKEENTDTAFGRDHDEKDAASDSSISDEQNESDTLDENTAVTGNQNNSQLIDLPDILPQYKSFYKRYPDLFGWLKIPDTEIDHPVMQSDDEKRGERYYYLHRDFTGKKAEEGSLFVESRSSSFPQDDNTVIYGHNMSNGHNFGLLEKYKEPDFYESHQTIQYDTIYETGTYQVAAVLMSRVLYQEEKGFRYYRFYNYSTDSEFQECVDFIKENRLYDTGVKLQYGDKLLMLSTCEYSRENGRLVVVAKRVEQ